MLQYILHQFIIFVADEWHTLAYGVLLLGIFHKISLIIHVYQTRPRNITIANPFGPAKWIKNLDFILNGPKIILEAYQNGKPSSFALPALAEHQILASSEDDIKAYCNAPQDVLSSHAALTDRIQHKYTLFGFEYSDVDPHDKIPNRALKVLLRANLPILRPIMAEKVRDGFLHQLKKGDDIGGSWVAVPAFSLAKQIVKRVNTRIMLGEEIAKDDSLNKTAFRYTEDVLVCAEIARQLPWFLTPIIIPLMMRWSGAMKRLASRIGLILEQRLRYMTAACTTRALKKPSDCIQWMLDSSSTPAEREIKRLVGQMLGLLLGSSIQLSMTLVYTMYTLCDHPEYVPQLREEMELALCKNPGDPFREMHLLDSFLLETARLNPADALSVQKKVLKPFSLPSGAYLPPGNLIATPQQALSLNADIFPEPNTFNPKRFLAKSTEDRENRAIKKFTDVSYSFLYWGSPRQPCPGRWYAAYTLKLALLHLVMNYDIRFEQEKQNRYFFWTTGIVPRSSTRILLKKRNVKD